jgi:hypothetical protein
VTKKEKTYRERESEQQRGKKRYIERLVEDEEAADQIREYQKEEHPLFPEKEDR